MGITVAERNMKDTPDLHAAAGPLVGLAMAMVALLLMTFA